VDIDVETGTTDELVEGVLDSRLDGAFIASTGERPELDAVASFVEELVIISPASYRSIREYLQKSPLPKILVFGSGCHYRQRLEQYLNGEGAGVVNHMVFGTIDGIVGCVAAGLGITMLPRSVVERSARRKTVRVHPLPRAQGRVETRFVTHRARVRSVALERWIDVVASYQPTARRGTT